MASKSKTSINTRSIVILLHNEGFSFRQIAERTGVPKSTANEIVKRFNDTKSIFDRHRSGRPSISTPRDDRNLINMVKKNRRATSTQLSQQWKLSNGRIAHPSTVRRKLLAQNMQYKPAVKKPRLNKRHVLARKEFCNQLKSWSKFDWRKVKFSDEMNIELDNRKKSVMIRRRPSEKFNSDCIIERTKQGSSSIGIWACMDYDGIFCFCIFDGRLNQHTYIDILNTKLLPKIIIEQNNQVESVFQQTNVASQQPRP